MALGVTTLVDALADQLREIIVSGELAPGERITEQAVADRYAVARPTAKAAIERVVQIGILRRTANKTAVVPELTAEDIEDLYRVRLLLEHSVVKHLAQRRTAPSAAYSALDDMKRSIEQGEFASAVDSDFRFHVALVTTVGSPRLLRTYQTLMGEGQLCMARERSASRFQAFPNYEDHVAIIGAIASGAVKEAQRLMVAHFVNAVDRILGKPLDTKGWI
ncbi:MAG: GntR family transcriptional regulator [Propionibacteriaceae bacterium]|jgi:DNA-binding GntR family transcriptional regulator|nr:GntR family transcriptional regulator [Propionibacteriaceae bacterium]